MKIFFELEVGVLLRSQVRQDATILYFDNYMNSSWSQGKIEESRKKYRRRKNLDKLI